MQLLEREHHLDVLGDGARRAAAGAGSVVLVAGEAGIGKTVLLRAFVEQTRDQLQPLWGMCDSLSTPRPLGPLRDVAHDLGDPVPELLRGTAAPHEVFTAVLDALRGRPRMLVVEDVHWGDEATLDLVRFLGRRIAGLPLLLVLSYRDALGVEHPLSPVVGDLVATPDTRRLQLTPLSRNAVAELFAGHGTDPADVHHRTAGNPFFVSQILAQPDSPLPASVRDAVLARVASLDAPARKCLELLSCTPEPVTRDLLGALAVPTATVGVLAATGLLDRQGDGVAFRHEIARSAVLEATAPGSEATLHGVMIEALEAVGGEPSVLAHHAAAAGDAERVLTYAPVAAEDASRAGAHREAVAFYETALRHVDGVPGEDSVRARLLEGVALDLYLSDRLREAITAREEAIELRAAAGDTDAVGAGHTALAGFFWGAADRAAAEHHADAAVELLSATDNRRALAFALCKQGFLAAWRGDVRAVQRAGEQVDVIAAELGDDVVLRSTASIGKAVTRLLQGDVSGRADLVAAMEVGLRHRLDDLTTTPMANLCHYDVDHGRLADAEVSVADGLRISEERDAPICVAYLNAVRARLRLLQGRWAEAEDDSRIALAATDIRLGWLWPNLVLGLLAARREAPPGNPHLDEMWRIANLVDSPGLVAAAAEALAENAWITRTSDPRLDDRVVENLYTRDYVGRDVVVAPLSRWLHRLAAAGVQESGVPDPGPSQPPDDQPYAQAIALWDKGSTDDLLDALRRLDALDARAVAALVRARLREAGVNAVPRGSSSATRANPAGLTARQLDVLALLVDGLTNADIAARLVISPKTADHHVTAILAKLRVHSRSEAAAVGRRLGVVGTAQA